MPELILINGDEEFLKERMAQQEIALRLITDIHTFDYTDIDQYLEEISTPLIFGGIRAFIVNNCKQVPELPDGFDVLVAISSGKKKLSDARASKTHEFPIFKTYSNNNEVVKWILNEGKSLNIDLSRVATALFLNNGKSLRKLYSEIKKLAVVTPPGGTVTPEIARSLLCFSAELTPKDIVEAVCEGNTLKALSFYDKLQQFADETGWVLAYMQRHVIQQLRIEILSQRGLKSDDISQTLEIHPYVFRQVHEPRLGYWTMDSLRSSLEVFCTLDLSHKRGDVGTELGLELELIRLSEEAKNVVKHRNR
jgi:DNA polymerase III delta subunit